MLLLILAMIFNIFAQLILKKATVGIAFNSWNSGFFMQILMKPEIWLGAASYGISFFIYIMAISRGELSRIAPVSQALTVVGLVIASVVFFNETLDGSKIAGIVIVLVGVIILNN